MRSGFVVVLLLLPGCVAPGAEVRDAEFPAFGSIIFDGLDHRWEFEFRTERTMDAQLRQVDAIVIEAQADGQQYRLAINGCFQLLWHEVANGVRHHLHSSGMHLQAYRIFVAYFGTTGTSALGDHSFLVNRETEPHVLEIGPTQRPPAIEDRFRVDGDSLSFTHGGKARLQQATFGKPLPCTPFSPSPDGPGVMPVHELPADASSAGVAWTSAREQIPSIDENLDAGYSISTVAEIGVRDDWEFLLRKDGSTAQLIICQVTHPLLPAANRYQCRDSMHDWEDWGPSAFTAASAKWSTWSSGFTERFGFQPTGASWSEDFVSYTNLPIPVATVHAYEHQRGSNALAGPALRFNAQNGLLFAEIHG